MRHPLRVRSMPGTGKAPARGPLHALPPSREQGRHLASVRGGGWGTSFQETLYPQLPWGLQAHLAAPPVQGAWPPHCHPAWWPSRGWGGAVTLSPFPGAWEAAGDTGPQGCWEPGMRGPSEAGWVALPVCPICPWGQQAQGLACVVRQGPARLAEREGHWDTHSGCLCTRQATHCHPTSPHPCSLCLSCTSGTSAIWCSTPHARQRQAARAVCHGPRSTFLALTPLGPMAMTRDDPCQGSSPA